MKIDRWCAYQNPKPPSLLGLGYDNHMELGGYIIELYTFDSLTQLRTAQRSNRVRVLLNLESDATTLSQGTRDWLVARGVVIDPGDKVLNVLRKVRTAAGLTADDIDISSPS